MRIPLILTLGLSLDLPLELEPQDPWTMGVFSARIACPLTLESNLDSEGRQAGMKGAQALVAEVQGLTLFHPLHAAGNEAHNAHAGPPFSCLYGKYFWNPKFSKFKKPQVLVDFFCCCIPIIYLPIIRWLQKSFLNFGFKIRFNKDSC